MTALSTLAPALKRELAVPGTFDTVFPDTTDVDLVGSLADGFGEAQLFGFFGDVTLVSSDTDWVTDPDLSAAGATLVVIYTSMRIIRSQLRVLSSSERYKAGATEMEITRSAMLLRDELKFLRDRLDQLTLQARRPARAATVMDGYVARNIEASLYGGFFPYEFGGWALGSWK